MGVAGDASAVAAGRKHDTGTRCELWAGAAAVHCAIDSTFLCLHCDAKLHGTNFMASRHLRHCLTHESGAVAAAAASSSSCVSTGNFAESTVAVPAP